MSIYVKEGKSKNTLHWFNSKLHRNYQPQTLATKLFLRFLFVIDENDKYQHPHPQDANDDGGLTFPGICFHDVGDKDIVGWGSIAGRDGPAGTTRHTSEQPQISMSGVPKDCRVIRAKMPYPKTTFQVWFLPQTSSTCHTSEQPQIYMLGAPKDLFHALGVKLCQPHLNSHVQEDCPKRQNV